MITDQTRAEWRRDLFTRLRWEVDRPPIVRGDCLRVFHDGLIGWQRPRGTDRLAAAAEKITHDLGVEMGLPMAPTLLIEAPWWGSDTPQAVSLQCFAFHQQVAGDPPLPALGALAALVCAYPHGMHLEGWDRGGQPTPLIYDVCGPHTLRLIDGPGRTLSGAEHEHLELLSEDAIHAIVTRVPRTFLDTLDPWMLADRLIARRRRLLAGETRPAREDWSMPQRRAR